MAQATATRSRRPRAARTAGTASVLAWELRKLVPQKRAWLGLAAAILAPVILVVAMSINNTPLPADYPYGRYVKDNGFAEPLLLLGFGAIWFIPILTAIVSGDIFSSEDHNGTLKTFLTRSVNRRQVFVGKVLAAFAYSILLIVLLAGLTILLGGLRFGFDPLQALSGQQLTPGHALALVTASWALALAPVIAFTAIGLAASALTRNSVAGVVTPLLIALVMQLTGFVNLGGSTLRHFMLTTQFETFHALLHEPTYWPMIWRTLWVCALYTLIPLIAAHANFARRDVVSG